ncbi:gamma-glutamyl phosphate reductase [Clostridia bacterium]|nr:gamma-glutamyl phosphate reductase [Clostridia bacterium]
MSNIVESVRALCLAAKTAAYSLALTSPGDRNHAILILADKLQSSAANRAAVLEKNALDVASAESNGITPVMVDRLRLNGARLDAIAESLRKVAALPDPLGGGDNWTRPNGLMIKRVRVPLGVIGVIYESRPNVTVDAAALCIKSGNAVVLRGGKEAINSNLYLASLIKDSLREANLGADAVQILSDTSREGANAMMKAHGLIDVLIPRGNASLINSVRENASVPVIETGVGNCHIYVDESADFTEAAHIINRSKARASVCNAVETILIHEKIYKEFLPAMAKSLDEFKVELRGCEKTLAVLGNRAVPASDEDFYTEFSDYILSVKVVPGTDEAIEHINKYSTKHSEAILTNDYKNARKFQDRVDAAAVYVNASTRFTDGEEFGFGAEIGISTSKLHVRGPVGPADLTTVKYLIEGDGQTR